MMDQRKWELWDKAFKNDELWKHGPIIEDYDADPSLFDWFECDSHGPATEIKDQISSRGYWVGPGERDSFGWLTGYIIEKGSGREIVFG